MRSLTGGSRRCVALSVWAALALVTTVAQPARETFSLKETTRRQSERRKVPRETTDWTQSAITRARAHAMEVGKTGVFGVRVGSEGRHLLVSFDPQMRLVSALAVDPNVEISRQTPKLHHHEVSDAKLHHQVCDLLWSRPSKEYMNTANPNRPEPILRTGYTLTSDRVTFGQTRPRHWVVEVRGEWVPHVESQLTVDGDMVQFSYLFHGDLKASHVATVRLSGDVPQWITPPRGGAHRMPTTAQQARGVLNALEGGDVFAAYLRFQGIPESEIRPVEKWIQIE